MKKIFYLFITLSLLTIFTACNLPGNSGELVYEVTQVEGYENAYIDKDHLEISIELTAEDLIFDLSSIEIIGAKFTPFADKELSSKISDTEIDITTVTTEVWLVVTAADGTMYENLVWHLVLTNNELPEIPEISAVLNSWEFNYEINQEFVGGTIKVTIKLGEEVTEEIIEIKPEYVVGFDTSEEGRKSIIVIYEGISMNTYINVSDSRPVEYSIELAKWEESYGLNEEFKGGSVLLVGKKGDKVVSEEEISLTLEHLSGFDTTTVGEKEVVITVNGLTVSEKITVVDNRPVVSTIELGKWEENYEYGEEFKGGSVIITTTKGEEVISQEEVVITLENLSGFDTKAEGTKEVVITVNGLTVTAKITVVDNRPVASTIELGKWEESYELNEAFKGGSVIITTTKGDEVISKEEVAVTLDNVSGFDTKVEGTKEVVITVNCLTVTAKITVVDNRPVVTKVALGKWEQSYELNEAFKGGTVIITKTKGDELISEEEVEILESQLKGFDTTTAGIKEVEIIIDGQVLKAVIDVVDNTPVENEIIVTGGTVGNAIYSFSNNWKKVTINGIPTATDQWARWDFANLSSDVAKVILTLKTTEGYSISAKVDGDGNPYDSKAGNKQYKATVDGELVFEWDLEEIGIDPTKVLKLVFWVYDKDQTVTSATFELVHITYELKEVEEHEHKFVDGKCECGEIDPDYVEPEEPVENEIIIKGTATGSSIYAFSNNNKTVTVTGVPASVNPWARWDFGALSSDVAKVILTLKTTEGYAFGFKVDGDGNPYDAIAGNKQYKSSVDGELVVEWNLEELGIDPTKVVKLVFWVYDKDQDNTTVSFDLVHITYELKEVEEHEHKFVDGKCECGEIDPDYVEPEEPVENEIEVTSATTGNSIYSISSDYKTVTVSKVPSSMNYWSRWNFNALSGDVAKVILTLKTTEGYALAAKVDGDGNPYDSYKGNKQYKATVDGELVFEWNLTDLGMDPTKVVKIVFWAYDADQSVTEVVFELVHITYELKEEEEHKHEFVDGKCECGEVDPDYVAPELPKEPYTAPVSGTASSDASTMYFSEDSKTLILSEIPAQSSYKWARWNIDAPKAAYKLVTVTLTATSDVSVCVRFDDANNKYNVEANKQYKKLLAGVATEFTFDLEALGIDATEIVKFVIMPYTNARASEAVSITIGEIVFATEKVEHVHEFIDGKCECGEIDPDYVAPEEPIEVSVELVSWTYDYKVGEEFKGATIVVITKKGTEVSEELIEITVDHLIGFDTTTEGYKDVTITLGEIVYNTHIYVVSDEPIVDNSLKAAISNICALTVAFGNTGSLEGEEFDKVFKEYSDLEGLDIVAERFAKAGITVEQLEETYRILKTKYYVGLLEMMSQVEELNSTLAVLLTTLTGQVTREALSEIVSLYTDEQLAYVYKALVAISVENPESLHIYGILHEELTYDEIIKLIYGEVSEEVSAALKEQFENAIAKGYGNFVDEIPAEILEQYSVVFTALRYVLATSQEDINYVFEIIAKYSEGPMFDEATIDEVHFMIDYLNGLFTSFDLDVYKALIDSSLSIFYDIPFAPIRSQAQLITDLIKSAPEIFDLFADIIYSVTYDELNQALALIQVISEQGMTMEAMAECVYILSDKLVAIEKEYENATELYDLLILLARYFGIEGVSYSLCENFFNKLEQVVALKDGDLTEEVINQIITMINEFMEGNGEIQSFVHLQYYANVEVQGKATKEELLTEIARCVGGFVIDGTEIDFLNNAELLKYDTETPGYHSAVFAYNNITFTVDYYVFPYEYEEGRYVMTYEDIWSENYYVNAEYFYLQHTNTLLQRLDIWGGDKEENKAPVKFRLYDTIDDRKVDITITDFDLTQCAGFDTSVLGDHIALYEYSHPIYGTFYIPISYGVISATEKIATHVETYIYRNTLVQYQTENFGELYIEYNYGYEVITAEDGSAYIMYGGSVTETITADMIRGLNTAKLGSQDIIISYQGISTERTVKVISQEDAKVLISAYVDLMNDGNNTISIENAYINLSFAAFNKYGHYEEIKDVLVEYGIEFNILNTDLQYGENYIEIEVYQNGKLIDTIKSYYYLQFDNQISHVEFYWSNIPLRFTGDVNESELISQLNGFEIFYTDGKCSWHDAHELFKFAYYEVDYSAHIIYIIFNEIVFEVFYEQESAYSYFNVYFYNSLEFDHRPDLNDVIDFMDVEIYDANGKSFYVSGREFVDNYGYVSINHSQNSVNVTLGSSTYGFFYTLTSPVEKYENYIIGIKTNGDFIFENEPSAEVIFETIYEVELYYKNTYMYVTFEEFVNVYDGWVDLDIENKSLIIALGESSEIYITYPYTIIGSGSGEITKDYIAYVGTSKDLIFEMEPSISDLYGYINTIDVFIDNEYFLVSFDEFINKYGYVNIEYGAQIIYFYLNSNPETYYPMSYTLGSGVVEGSLHVYLNNELRFTDIPTVDQIIENISEISVNFPNYGYSISAYDFINKGGYIYIYAAEGYVEFRFEGLVTTHPLYIEGAGYDRYLVDAYIEWINLEFEEAPSIEQVLERIDHIALQYSDGENVWLYQGEIWNEFYNGNISITIFPTSCLINIQIFGTYQDIYFYVSGIKQISYIHFYADNEITLFDTIDVEVIANQLTGLYVSYTNGSTEHINKEDVLDYINNNLVFYGDSGYVYVQSIDGTFNDSTNIYLINTNNIEYVAVKFWNYNILDSIYNSMPLYDVLGTIAEGLDINGRYFTFSSANSFLADYLRVESFEEEGTTYYNLYFNDCLVEIGSYNNGFTIIDSELIVGYGANLNLPRNNFELESFSAESIINEFNFEDGGWMCGEIYYDIEYCVDGMCYMNNGTVLLNNKLVSQYLNITSSEFVEGYNNINYEIFGFNGSFPVNLYKAENAEKVKHFNVFFEGNLLDANITEESLVNYVISINFEKYNGTYQYLYEEEAIKFYNEFITATITGMTSDPACDYYDIEIKYEDLTAYSCIQNYKNFSVENLNYVDIQLNFKCDMSYTEVPAEGFTSENILDYADMAFGMVEYFVVDEEGNYWYGYVKLENEGMIEFIESYCEIRVEYVNSYEDFVELYVFIGYPGDSSKPVYDSYIGMWFYY